MTRRPAALHPVAVLSRWTGFCLPCRSEERPLVLTWTGRRGVRAWLGGASFADGQLRLTCACCGGVDVVGWDDEPALPWETETEVETEVEVQALAAEPVPVAEPTVEAVATELAAEPVAPGWQPAVPPSAPLREVHAELQALLGDGEVPVTWHQPVAEPVAEAAPEPVAEVAPEPAAAPEPQPAPAAPVVRVVQVVDLDAPSAGALHAVSEVAPAPQPARAERRAAERAARRAPAPRGVADDDALDVLHLVS